MQLKKKKLYLKQIGSIPFKNLIFLDESGVNLEMRPLYGRAFSQERAVLSSKFRRTKNMTIIGAIDYQKVMAATYGQWAANGEIFIQFLESQLCPKLKPHHVIIMDNIRFHQVKGVRELIEGTGAILVATEISAFNVPKYVNCL